MAMLIQTNEEGRKAIQALCDVALKTGGFQNLTFINQVVCSVRPIPPQETPAPKNVKEVLNAAEGEPCSAA